MRAYTFGGGIWSSLFHNFTPYDFSTRYDFSSPREGPSVVTRALKTEKALAVNVFGGADAFGLDSTATATASLQVVDRGLATFAIGSASFAAAARGNSAFATAYGGVAITGADLSVVSTETATASGSDGMAETTSLSFVAIGLKFDLGCQAQVERAESHIVDTNLGALQGNSAFFNVDAVAAGDNSFVDVQADAVVVEDALSTVTVSATATVNAEVAYTEIVGSSRPDRSAPGLATRSSLQVPVTTMFCQVPGMTGFSQAGAATRFTQGREAIPSLAKMARTDCTAAKALTGSSAARATTRFPAAAETTFSLTAKTMIQ